MVVAGKGQQAQACDNKWSNGELSTLIYGVLRLGEKEFTDIMGPYGQTIFMKREHELKSAQD